MGPDQEEGDLTKLQMGWLSLKNDQFRFKTLGKSPIILDESISYTLTK